MSFYDACGIFFLLSSLLHLKTEKDARIGERKYFFLYVSENKKPVFLNFYCWHSKNKKYAFWFEKKVLSLSLVLRDAFFS